MSKKNFNVALGEAARLAVMVNPAERMQITQTIDTLIGAFEWSEAKRDYVLTWPKPVREKAKVDPGFREVVP